MTQMPSLTSMVVMFFIGGGVSLLMWVLAWLLVRDQRRWNAKMERWAKAFHRIYHSGE